MPYVNRWGVEEHAELLRIAYDRNGDRQAIYYDDEPGTDVPDFWHQNFQRQRECTAVGLCQVCATLLPWEHRLLVLGELSTERVDVNGQQRWVVHEPWLCHACAEFALRYCPGLIRRRKDEKLTLLTDLSPDRVGLVASRGWFEGPLRRASTKLQPTIWLKIAVA